MRHFSIHSIFFKTTLLFSLLVLLLIGAVFALNEIEKERILKEVGRSGIPMILYLDQYFQNRNKTAIDDIMIQEAADRGFLPISDSSIIEAVYQHGISLRDVIDGREGGNRHPFPEPSAMPPDFEQPPHGERPPRDHDHEHFVEITVYDDRYFLVSDREKIAPFVFEFEPATPQIPLTIILPITLGVVLLVYIGIVRSLLPVREILQKIDRFDDNQLDISFASSRKDEIASIANAFDHSIQQIRELIDTRRLFVRNIMHELKTPIATGKIAATLLEPSKYQQRLIEAFDRQEQLLNEFYRIESIASGSIALNLQPCNLQDVLDEAKELLFTTEGTILAGPMNGIVNVDFSQLSVAFKNLIDNGLKYSSNAMVTITQEDNKILFESLGKPLPHPLVHYASPYALKGSKEKESRGFGFGLYITWHICRLHRFELTYHRENDKNIFSIVT